MSILFETIMSFGILQGTAIRMSSTLLALTYLVVCKHPNPTPPIHMKRRRIKCLFTAAAYLLLASAQSSFGQQILGNTGFEAGDNITPWVSHGSDHEVLWSKHTGARSIHIFNRSNAKYGARQSIMGEINQGQVLDISAWVKLKNGSDSANSKILILKKVSGTWKWDTVATKATNGWSWQKLEGAWTANWNGTLQHLSVCVAGPDKTIPMLIDDVTATIRGGSVTPPPSTGSNMIENGTFESNSLSPWGEYGAVQDSNVEWQGYNSSRSGRSANRGATSHCLRQNIAGKVTKGEAITFTAYMKLHTWATSTGRIRLRRTDASGGSWVPISSTSVNGAGWTKIEGTWTADWSGSLNSLYMHIDGPNAAYPVLIDNVSAIANSGGNGGGDCSGTYSYSVGNAAVELQNGSWFNRRANRGHNNADERFGNGYWNSHGYYMDITSWTGNILVDYPVPNYSAAPKTWGLPFTVAWDNNRSVNANPAHEEFNIRRRRSWHYGGGHGYGITPIRSIPRSRANMTFAGEWDGCPEGSVFINMTMWVQSRTGDMFRNGGERIDIIVHEYDTGEFDLARQAPYITRTNWTVLPDFVMAGSTYKVIKRKPGDKGEKCSYNLVRAFGDNRTSGTINARDIFDHLIQDGEFNDGWNLADSEWTVTAQGPVYRNYLEGQGLPTAEILTTPSKGKWTFNQATFPDIDGTGR